CPFGAGSCQARQPVSPEYVGLPTHAERAWLRLKPRDAASSLSCVSAYAPSLFLASRAPGADRPTPHVSTDPARGGLGPERLRALRLRQRPCLSARTASPAAC